MLTNETDILRVAQALVRTDITTGEQLVDSIAAVLGGDPVTFAELWRVVHEDCAASCTVTYPWEPRTDCHHHPIAEQCAIAAIDDGGTLAVLSDPNDETSRVSYDWDGDAWVVLSADSWHIDDDRIEQICGALDHHSDYTFTLWRNWEGGPIQLCWLGSLCMVRPDDVSPQLLALMRRVLTDSQ